MNKTILLTGGSAGIGKATALCLMKNGYTVYALSRSGCPNQQDAASGGKLISICADVTKPQTLEQAVAQIVSEQGGIYGVICNAGNGIAGAVEDTSLTELEYQFATNYYGVVNTVQACLPQLRKQGWGKIITVSSMAAVAPIPFQTFYSSVKSAILAFTEALSLEIKPFGIDCACVLPGDVKTNFTNARKYTEASTSENSVYTKAMKQAVGTMEKDEQNGMSPDAIARTMLRLLRKKRMPMRVIPGFSYKALSFIIDCVPASFKVWVIGKLY
jgi:short-subunit dehydrogenase